MSPAKRLSRILTTNERLTMAKHGIYRTSNKPAHLARGNAEGVSGIIAPPVKYRAGDNTYTETKGLKLYKKGGTLATRVIKQSFTPELKVVNVRENVWREGL
jgi:hypothetical protein